MLLGEDQHPGGIAQFVRRRARFRQFVDAVVDDQPSMPRQDRRSAATDLELLPWRYRAGQPTMRGKVAEVIGLAQDPRSFRSTKSRCSLD